MRRLRPPPLLDDILTKQSIITSDKALINGKWYIAKPTLVSNLWQRLYYAWLVLRGRAMAWQYAEDRYK